MKARSSIALSVTALVACASMTAAANAQQTKSGQALANGVRGNIVAPRYVDRVPANAFKNPRLANQSEGSIAVTTSLMSECWESLTAGLVLDLDPDDQNGWFAGVIGTGTAGQVIIDGTGLNEGSNSLRMDAGPGTAITGAQGPDLGQQVNDRFTLQFTARLSSTAGTAAQNIEFQGIDLTAGAYAGRVRVLGNGAIEVRDLTAVKPAAVFAWVPTGQTVAANTSFTIRGELDANVDAGQGFNNGRVRYFLNNSTTPFYVANGTGGIAYENFQAAKMNTMAAVSIDCINVRLIPASCEADVANFDGEVNVNDLLLVITNWGNCPAEPAFCDGNVISSTPEAVNVNDLLAVITSWGSCPLATGACCSGGSCFVGTFPDCVAGTAPLVFGGYDSVCADIEPCPPPAAAHDNCDSAMAVTSLPFSDTQDPDSYTVEVDDPFPCGADAFTQAGNWWYRITIPAGVNSITISTCGNGTTEDSHVGLLPNDCALLTADVLACDDDSCEAPGVFGRFNLTVAGVLPGEQYLIVVGNYAGGGSNGGLFEPVTVTITSP